MKKFITSLVFLSCLIGVQAQETHTIISSSPYNIRTLPGVDSEVVGTTAGLSSLKVYEIKEGWAKIKHGNDTAYVKDDCILSISEEDRKAKKAAENELIENTKWMVFVCFCLSIVLAVFVVKRFGTIQLSNSAYIANLVAFNSLCILEWLYLETSGDVFLWFLNPDYVSGMFLLNAVFFSFLAISQSLSFYFTMMDIKERFNARFNLYAGLWSIPGVIVFSIIAGSLWGEVAVVITILLFILCQIFQVLFIFGKMLKTAGFVQSLIASFTYIIGFVTTLIVASIFFIILMLYIYKKTRPKVIEKHHYYY